MKLRIHFKIAAAVTLLTMTAPAHADPITVAIFGAAFAATFAGAVTTFIITSLITIGLSLVANALFGPKPSGQERQASVLQLTIGEQPREAIFGTIATAPCSVDLVD